MRLWRLEAGFRGRRFDHFREIVVRYGQIFDNLVGRTNNCRTSSKEFEAETNGDWFGEVFGMED